MIWDRIELDRAKYKRFAGAHRVELTDDDPARIGGRQSQPIGRVQQRYGIALAEAERQVLEWVRRL